MAKLDCKTKNGSTSRGKQKVYFTCHPDDFDRFFPEICKDIFRSQDCAVYYNTERDIPWTEEDADIELEEMSLFVIPFSGKFLSEENEARCFELPFALDHHIPVLLIMREKGLEEKFNKVCGNIQVLDGTPNDDATTIPYERKLERKLSSVLTDDIEIDEIRREFQGHIFLSYRKKDRKLAQDLMRLIHQLDQFRDVAIWYDEFLVPGEDFNESIRESLEQSDLVTFAITPNVLEKGNYVMDCEFPQASQSHKPILPAEMEPTDRNLLEAGFPGIPEPVDPHDKSSLLEKLSKYLGFLNIRAEDDTPEHLLRIGRAYLNGIDVEKNSELGFNLIGKAAEMGDAEAQYQMALCYEDGIGTAADHGEAVQWYLKAAGQDHQKALYEVGIWANRDEGPETAMKFWIRAAENGYAPAQYQMGECYAHREGVSKNYEKAVEWYRKAAEQGDADAQYELGRCYASGDGVDQDFKKAVEWFQKAAEQGDESALDQLGNCYASGLGTDQSVEKALVCWNRIAEAEDTTVYGIMEDNAKYKIGLCYYFGRGVEKNDEEAEKWFRSVVEEMYDARGLGMDESDLKQKILVDLYTKSAMEQADLNLCYDAFIGESINDICEMALEWYRQPAGQGDTEAQFILGFCYANMKVADQDFEKALEWWNRAAENGCADAQYKAGLCHYKGQGTKQDYQKAIDWFRKAAEQDHPAAQYYLGKCYYAGKGVAQSDEKAAEWFTKAAELDNAEAQYYLGILYADGKGVDQDCEQAVKWWEKASVPTPDHLNIYLSAVDQLSHYYANGIDTPQDDKKAAECYFELATSGVPEGQYLLGCCYDEGKGVARDPDEAVYWWRYAAGQGHEKALECWSKADVKTGDNAYEIGRCYYRQGTKQSRSETEKWFKKAVEKECFISLPCINDSSKTTVEWYTRAAMEQASLNLSFQEFIGQDLSRIYEMAFEWYAKPAEEGDADAQYNLGIYYATVQDPGQSYEKALDWWFRSAEQGRADAQFECGLCFYNGRGTGQDYGKAVDYFRKAAEQGHAAAQYYLGMCYFSGKGIGQNDEKAAEWYLKAAEQDYAPAQFYLGLCYADGKGLEQNDEKAVEWWEKASTHELDSPSAYLNALNRLSICYADGLGTGQDSEKAADCYQGMAIFGDPDAQYLLGCCFDEGKGVARDQDKAKYWWQCAAAQGHEGAKEKLSSYSDTD